MEFTTFVLVVFIVTVVAIVTGRMLVRFRKELKKEKVEG